MNTSTQPQETNGAAAPAAPAAPALEEMSLEGRAAHVAQQIRDAEAAGAKTADDGKPDAAPPAGPSPAGSAEQTVEQRAAARRERLAALTAQDRERVDRKAKLAAQDKATAEVAELRKRLDEAEARANARVDVDALDDAAVFRLLTKKGVSPQKLAEHIRESIANPERMAEAAALDAARKAVDPEIKSLRDKLAALEERDQQREAYLQQQQAHQREQHAAQQFFSFTEQNAAHAPYAHAFLKNYGGEEFYKLAAGAAQNLPPGAGWQPMLDVIEEQLSKLAAIYGSQEPAPSKGKAPPSRAAAKANTVSNRDAATRSAVRNDDDEDALASLSLDERAERLVKRLAGSS